MAHVQKPDFVFRLTDEYI